MGPVLRVPFRRLARRVGGALTGRAIWWVPADTALSRSAPQHESARPLPSLRTPEVVRDFWAPPAPGAGPRRARRPLDPEAFAAHVGCLTPAIIDWLLRDEPDLVPALLRNPACTVATRRIIRDRVECTLWWRDAYTHLAAWLPLPNALHHRVVASDWLVAWLDVAPDTASWPTVIARHLARTPYWLPRVTQRILALPAVPAAVLRVVHDRLLVDPGTDTGACWTRLMQRADCPIPRFEGLEALRTRLQQPGWSLGFFEQLPLDAQQSCWDLALPAFQDRALRCMADQPVAVWPGLTAEHLLPFLHGEDATTRTAAFHLLARLDPPAPVGARCDQAEARAAEPARAPRTPCPSAARATDPSPPRRVMR